MNSMQITAEDARAAREHSAISPKCVTLRLDFNYSVEGEMSQRPLRHSESVALLFEPEVSERDIDARLVATLTALGAELPPLMGRRWRSVHLPKVSVGVMDTEMKGFDEALANAPSEERALARCAEIAREVGAKAAEESGAVGWRLPQDYSAAATVTQGLGMAFEDLHALREALQVRREIGAHIADALPPSPASSRPSL